MQEQVQADVAAYAVVKAAEGAEAAAAKEASARLTRARLHGSTIFDVRGAKALQGSVIDHEQVVPVGLSLIADAGIEVDDDR